MAASKDKTAPKLSSSTPKSNASVELGSDITLKFNEAIKAGNGSITITNGADTRVIPIIDPQISISGKTLILNPKDDLYSGSIYSVVISNNAIQDTAGNAYVPAKTPLSFTTKGVPSTTPITVKPIQPSDTIAPVFTSAKVNGTSLIMSFNDTDLLNTATALASSFSVISNGIDNSVTDIFVNPTSKTVALLLTNPVLNAQTVTVAYNDQTKDNDVNALQDISGNDVASFSAQSVVNNTKSSETVVTPKPVEPTFTLSPNVTSVDEGSTVKFIAISSVPAPKEGFDIPFVLSGTATVSDDYKEVYSSRVIHIPSGSTIGSVAFDTVKDNKTEGTESLVLSKDTRSETVTVNINDTSLTPAVTVPSTPVPSNTFSMTTADGGTLTASLNYKPLSELKNADAFAVIKSDGSVVTWGNENHGGDSSSVAKQLDGTIDVKQIYSNYGAISALRADGSVVTWGNSSSGGDSSSVAKQLDGTIDVTGIYFTTLEGGAFAALRTDGSVVTWGYQDYGGNSDLVTKQLDGTIDVTQIYPSSGAFAALRTDGSVVTWGNESWGGNSSSVTKQLDGTIDVTQIHSNGSAFAALRADGSVVIWGDDYIVGHNGTTLQNLDGTVKVTEIYSNPSAFVALRTDGSVVTWGGQYYGGDSNAVAKDLDGTVDVVKIAFDDYGFAALKQDGSIVTWGNVDSKAKDKFSLPTTFSSNEELAAYQSAQLKAYLAQGNSSSVKDKLSFGVVAFANPETDDFYAVNSNAINGTTSNDTLTGTDGNDSINGNGGFDSIDGGAGNDVITTINPNALSTIRGGNGDDIIVTSNSATVTGGEGNDYIKIPSGHKYVVLTITDFTFDEDVLDINAIDEKVSIRLNYIENQKESHLRHLVFFDVEKGTQAMIKNLAALDAFTLYKPFLIFDYSMENTVQKINGTDGKDVIMGGTEMDTMTGGNGADFFVLTSLSDAIDTIADFQSGTDKIQLGNMQTYYSDGTALDWVNKLSSSAYWLFQEDFISSSYNVTTTAVAADIANGGRFIFDKTAETLWFDTKGDTSVASSGVVTANNDDVAVLRLTGDATLKATDFIFG